MTIIYLLLILASLFVLLPVTWMVSTALKSEQEALAIPPTLFPKNPTTFGFTYMWKTKPFLSYLKNSLLVATPAAIISVISGSLAAYCISRFRFRYKKLFMAFILFTQMIPGILLVGSYFKILSILGMYNTRFGLSLAYIAVSLPFSIWMLKGYFDTIPRELDEAARVDGCSPVATLFRIIIPISIPGIVATAVFGFLLAWGDLLWVLCLITSESKFTITLGIANCVGEFRVIWPALMAAALISCVPSVIFYSLLQKYVVQGITQGSVKG